MIQTPLKPPARAALGLGLVFIVASALLFWIANGVAPWDSDRHNAWHHYEYLVDGFLQGHTYLSLAPDPALLKLKDSYDPDQNAPYRLWDASLYKGRYYLYYGPTPAILLMLPWRVITGENLPQRLAVAAFAVIGLAGLALLLWEVRQRYFPALSGLKLGLVLFVAMHAAWLPVTLRRPAFWELPIIAAIACLWWTIYFFWRCHVSGGKIRWAVATGLGLVFLLGARPTYIFTAGLIVGLLFVSGRAGKKTQRWPWATTLAAGVITILGGIALLLYNYARFGNFLEFGQSYQLWGMEERHMEHFSLHFVPFNAWLYLFSLPELSPYFPFFRTVWPASLPTGYVGVEEMHGALFALPVHLAGFAALAWAWRQRRGEAMQPLNWILGSAAGATLLAGSVLFCFAGGCSRYITELFAGWTVVTAIGLMVIFSLPPEGRRRGTLKLLTLCAAVWTLIYTWLASAEFHAFTRLTNSKIYTLAAHFFDYPSYWIMQRDGSVFGPAKLEVRLAPFVQSEKIVLLSSGRLTMLNQLLIDRIDAGHVRLQLVENSIVILTTPPLDVSGAILHVGVEAPWLYPPAAHPYWDLFTNDIERRELQTRFVIAAAGHTVSAYSRYYFDSARFQPFARYHDSEDSASAWIESMQCISVTPH